MDRTKAIELLKKALGCVQTDPRNCGKCKECKNYATKEDGIEAISMAIAALEKAETNCPEIPDSWIPVTKKLPEIGEWVLVCCMYGDGYMDQTIDSRAKDGNWWLNIEFNDPDPAECCKVIAWMPLPEPWKGEEE